MPLVPISNGSFEKQVATAPTTPVSGIVHDWTYSAGAISLGVYRPGVSYYASGVPNGFCVLWTGSASGGTGVGQYLPYKIKSGAKYTLRVKIGWPAPQVSTPVAVVNLYSQDTSTLMATLASPGSVNPTLVRGQFVQAEVTFTATDVAIGEPLLIYVGGTEYNQIDFDDFTLEVTEDTDLTGTVVYLDEKDPGASAPLGSWTDYGQVYYTQYYSGSIRGTVDVNGQYQFKPTIPATGKYRVSVWIPPSTGTYTSSVKYTVINAGTSGIVIIDQEANKGKWIELGEYDFNAGDSGYVYVSEGGGGFVAVDMVCWQQIITAIDVNAPVGGVSASSALGPLFVNADRSSQVLLSGVQANHDLGILSVLARQNASVPLFGVQADHGIGDPTVFIVNGISVYLSGLEADVQLGDLSVSTIRSPDVPLDGVEARGIAGTVGILIPGSAVNVNLGGVQIDSALGELVVVPAELVRIYGVQALSSIGGLEVVIGSWLPEPKPQPNWSKTPEPSTIWTKIPTPPTDWTKED